MIVLKIIAVGDIIGNAGVRELANKLKNLKQKENIDFCIVNGENSAEGMGITEKNFNDILEAGADVVTMGNHTWGKKDIFKFIDHPKLIRPANYPEGVVGKGFGIFDCNGKKIAVINALGRVDINILTENPFLIIKNIVEKIQNEVDMIFVDESTCYFNSYDGCCRIYDDFRITYHYSRTYEFYRGNESTRRA